MEKNSRLSMLDENGSRQAIIPAEVTGRFRQQRNLVHLVLFAIFLGLPWIEIHGRKLILLDIPNRKFEIFGHLFLAHDSPILFLLFAISVVSLMLATAIWGRVWCGWACPQTVFIDAIYRRVERLIEGNYLERRALAQAPLSFRKLRKLAEKWLAFVLLSSVFAHSFLAYFTGGPELLKMTTGSPSQNWAYFLMVSAMTSILAFNFGWFREQFCIIMCPYGRFQNVLMDSQSLNITYDQERGEPRKGQAASNGRQGDCVSCNRCVQVCPTGIDIRNGLQLECINCTACIDACDAIMKKVNKPVGLISYRAVVPKDRVRILRPRVVAYLCLLAFFSIGLSLTLHARAPFSIVVHRAKESPYQIMGDGRILNHFRVHLLNQSHETETFVFAAPKDSAVTLTQAVPSHTLNQGQSQEVHLFLNFPKELLDSHGRAIIKIEMNESSSQQTKLIDFSVIGPTTK